SDQAASSFVFVPSLSNPRRDGCNSRAAHPTEESLQGSAATESVRAADAQLRRNELFGAILAAAPDPVIAIDRSRRVRYANPACEELLGVTPAEVVGRDLAQLGAIDAEAARRGHVEIRLRSGETRWIAYASTELAPPDAPEPVTVFFLRDETERRRDELR